MIKFIKNRYINLPLPAKAAIWLVACQVLLKGIGVFSSPLFTRLLSPAEYGKLTLFLSYEQLILIFSTWELALGPYQKGLFKYQDHISHFTKTILFLSAALTVSFFLLVFFFWDFVNAFTGITKIVAIFMFVYILTVPAYQCWLTRSRVNYTYKSQTFVTVLLALLQVFMPLVAVSLIEATAEVKIIFTLLPAICINVLLCILSLCKKDENVEAHQRKQEMQFLLRFTPPLVFHSLSYLVLSQADRIMIGKMVGEAEAGIYGIAYMIANLAMMIQTSFCQVLTPWIYRKMERKEYSDIKQKTSGVFLLLGAIYIAFILVVPEIIKILYPPSYHEGIWCIPPIAIGVFFMFYYSLFVNIQEYFEETKCIAIISVACAALNIVLNYLGIKLFGYVACAYTTLLCYILFAVGHYAVMKLVLRKNNLKVEIYNKKILLLVGIAMLLFMALIMLLYNFMIIRYLLVVAFGVVLVIMRKQVHGIIKQLLKREKNEV